MFRRREKNLFLTKICGRHVALFRKAVIITVSFVCAGLLASCSILGGGSSGSSSSSNGPLRDNTPQVLVPEATGEDLLGNSSVSIDASNKSKGYVVAQYSGSNDDVKFLITPSGQERIMYDLHADTPEVFPLVAGDTSYKIEVMEGVGGTQYSPLYDTTIDAQIENEFLPFLYPNQYVWFTSSSNAVAKGQEILDDNKVQDDVEAVQAIYNFIVDNIKYDFNKADEAVAGGLTGYLPNVDETLESQSGICFDYAALTTAMLRSQGIPTKLVIGYAGDVYHAWLSIYTEETGWVNNAIEFHGSEWVRMDPTFASTSHNDEYTGDGQSYNPVGYY